MSTIAVAGNPYEQGLSHGRQLGGDIHINLDLIRAYLAEKHCDPQMVERVNAANLEFLTAHCPEAVDEYQGLAAGCGLELREIALINTPVYFLHDYLQQGCSMLLAKAPATADGCTYLIKNRDIGLPLRQCMISRDYGRGNKITEQNSAGIITMPGIGINNAGLAIATTGCWPKYQQIDFALAASHYLQVNIHLLLRNCQTVRQVIAYLHHLPRMTGMNLIAADATGEAPFPRHDKNHERSLSWRKQHLPPWQRGKQQQYCMQQYFVFRKPRNVDHIWPSLPGLAKYGYLIWLFFCVILIHL